MRFVEDAGLYGHTQACLDWLRRLDPGGERPERCHLYWRGPFGRKQAFAVKSFLATQDLERTELWLWLDAEDGWSLREESPYLRPLLPHLSVRAFDPEAETRWTPLEGRRDLYDGVTTAERSDLFRHVVLYHHGGLYADVDTMFLRDLGELPAGLGEFSYRWSSHAPSANSAVLHLRRGSELAHALLVRCAQKDSCHPQEILRLDEGDGIDLLVLPCVTFDPLWLHRDRRDRYRAAPFDDFAGFFRPFGRRHRRARGIRGFRDFFPGAFAYHWHNLWDAPEDERSYFGLFEAELDALLRERLAIDAPAPG